MGHTTGPWSQAQQINKIAEKQKNQGDTQPQSKLRPQPDCNAVVGT